MSDVSYGYCQCGCGEKTKISPHTVSRYGWVKGQPRPTIQGHSKRVFGSNLGAIRKIGQKHLNHAGYVQVYRPDHPNAPTTGWVMEHRLVMEKNLGRLLERNEVVHHKDHDPANNDLSNLELKASQGAHRQEHTNKAHGRWARGYDHCAACGTETVPHSGKGYCGDCYYENVWIPRYGPGTKYSYSRNKVKQ